jgi:hypothetical protein
VDATSTVLLSCSHRACIPCLQLEHGAPAEGQAAAGGAQKKRGKCADCQGPLTEAELKLFLPAEQVPQPLTYPLPPYSRTSTP